MKTYFGKISNQYNGVWRDQSNPNRFRLSGIFRTPDGSPRPISGRYYDNLEEQIDADNPKISHFYKLER